MCLFEHGSERFIFLTAVLLDINMEKKLHLSLKKHNQTCNFNSRIKILSLTSLNPTNFDVVNCIPEFASCL